MDAGVFVRKLELFAPLDEGDKSFLNKFIDKIVNVPAKQAFFRQGAAVGTVHILLKGMACRYKSIAGGKRQISAFIIPGDLCDPHLLILNKADHSVTTLCDCIVAELSKEQSSEMLERRNIARALFFSSLVEVSILREWVSNIGQRPAVERMAHLFYEMYIRMKLVDVVDGLQIELPLSQIELADSLGLSLVHTNKSLRVLREKGLVHFRGGTLTLLDIVGIKSFCQFNPAYLHPEGGKSIG